MDSNASDNEIDVLRQAAEGDAASWQATIDRHRDQLRRMAMFRLDRRLQSRLDPSDVVQDVFAEASRRLGDYLRQPTVPFFVWLRTLASQQLVTVHRRHFGAERRDARREMSLDQEFLDSSSAMAAQLAADDTSPSEAALKSELADRLRQALAQMEELDREVLALRHFEGLSNAETATVLNLTISAASKRYVRAAEKLRLIMVDLFGTSGSMPP